MLTFAKVSDFLITGCAVAPVVAFCAGRPEIALLAHVVLLLAGLGLAGLDREAPFRHPERFDRRKSD